jgi:hypothetical protein
MTTRAGFQAAGQLIRGLAGKWEAQAPQIGSIVDQVQTLKFHGYDPGLFKPAIDVHEQIIQKVTGRCTEGRSVFEHITDTLNGIAGAYERLDSASADRINKQTAPVVLKNKTNNLP